MAGEKPTAGFVLSIVGAVFWLIQALALFVLASFLESIGSVSGVGGLGLMGTAFAGISLVFFVIVLVGGVLMFMKPMQAKIWGILVLIFSIVGFFFLGGFFLGSILGLVGGILGIVFKPSAGMPMAPSMGPPPAQ